MGEVLVEGGPRGGQRPFHRPDDDRFENARRHGGERTPEALAEPLRVGLGQTCDRAELFRVGERIVPGEPHDALFAPGRGDGEARVHHDAVGLYATDERRQQDALWIGVVQDDHREPAAILRECAERRRQNGGAPPVPSASATSTRSASRRAGMPLAVRKRATTRSVQRIAALGRDTGTDAPERFAPRGRGTGRASSTTAFGRPPYTADQESFIRARKVRSAGMICPWGN